MGRAMADVPLFGTDFNTWFPLTLVIYCLLLYAARPGHCGVVAPAGRQAGKLAETAGAVGGLSMPGTLLWLYSGHALLACSLLPSSGALSAWQHSTLPSMHLPWKACTAPSAPLHSWMIQLHSPGLAPAHHRGPVLTAVA